MSVDVSGLDTEGYGVADVFTADRPLPTLPQRHLAIEHVLVGSTLFIGKRPEASQEGFFDARVPSPPNYPTLNTTFTISAGAPIRIGNQFPTPFDTTSLCGPFSYSPDQYL